MANSAREKAAVRRSASGFSLDYTCALSVRRGRQKAQARSAQQRKERRN